MKGGHASWEQHQRQKDVAFGLLMLVGLSGIVLLALWVQGLNHDLRAANGARDALAQQVQGLGAKPVAGPPGSRGEPGPAATGRPGARGPAGPSGPPGPSGSPGRSGASGQAGVSVTGSTGPPGAAGVNGTDGSDGAAGPAGPAGPQGDPGPAGADGKDGKDGVDGQTCPSGYSLQTPSYDPDALVCRRDGAPDPGGQGSPSPSSLAMDPQRKRYT